MAEEQYLIDPSKIGGSSGASSLFGAGGMFDKGGVFAAGSPLTSLIVGGLLASDQDVSGAGAGGAAAMDTSGTVIGGGSASGGALSMSGVTAWPWYVWPAGALFLMAVIKKAV